METVDVRGRFVWHELLTRDIPAAKKFYGSLAGWKTLPWPLDPDYIVCHADFGPVAGMQAIAADMPAEMPAHWLQYIGTRDVDATADEAVRAGGSIVKPPGTLSGAGRYAVLKDPQGAVFAVLDPEKAHPEVARPPLGAFTWHELATSDNEAAFAFYSRLFGWNAMQRMDMGPNGVYLIFGGNGVQRGGIFIKSADSPAPPSWLPYAHVPNIDEGFAWALGEGAQQLIAPMEVPGGSRVAGIVDPTGAAFAIHSPAPDVAESTPVESRPRVKSSAKKGTRPKAKAKAKAKAKTPVKTKAKAKRKSAPARKPSRRKPVPRKAAKKVARKTARKAARKSAKSVRRVQRGIATARKKKSRNTARRKK